MSARKTVLIVGKGTIGFPLIRLISEYQKVLDIKEVLFAVHSPRLESRGVIVDLCHWGAKLVVVEEKMQVFQALLKSYPAQPFCNFERAVERADVIIDCSGPSGNAYKLKQMYYKEKTNSKKLFIAQGAEEGFGTPYAFDTNNEILKGNQFIQVMSCNTHAFLAMLKTLVFDPHNEGTFDIENLIHAESIFLKRGDDVSQTKTRIGIDIEIPKGPYGGHRVADAARIYETMDIQTLNIHERMVTTSNPFTHVVLMDILIKEKIIKEEIEQRLRNNPLIAVTYGSRNNAISSEGYSRGYAGRIFNHAICHLPTLEIINRSEGTQILGSFFTPQTGNVLLSSIAAMLHHFNPDDYLEKMDALFLKPPFLFNEV